MTTTDAGFSVVEFCGAPGQIVGCHGQGCIGAGQAHIRRQGDSNRIAQAHCLKYAEQIMEAILPRRQNLETQVYLGMGVLDTAD